MNTQRIERRVTGAVAVFAVFALALLVAVAWVVVAATPAVADDQSVPVYGFDPTEVQASNVVTTGEDGATSSTLIVYVPVGQGANIRISDLDGGVGRTLCEVAITDAESVTGDCVLLPFERDATGVVDGVRIQLLGLTPGDHLLQVASQLVLKMDANAWDASHSTWAVKRVEAFIEGGDQ